VPGDGWQVEVDTKGKMAWFHREADSGLCLYWIDWVHHSALQLVLDV